MSTKKIYAGFIKSFFDKLTAVLLLLLCSPILLVSSLVLIVVNRGKALFFQQRIGKDEAPFMLWKFRTLIEGEENRATTFGSVLRVLSIDELPQLVNVLKGEMSIAGPRPLFPEYLPFYTEEEKERHRVKPGITGLAQVNGRNSLDWGERMKLDQYYTRHISFWLDLKILFLTFLQFFRFKQADFIAQNQETFSEYAKRR